MANTQIIDIAVFDSGRPTRALLLERLAQLPDCSLRSFERFDAVSVNDLGASASVLVLNHHGDDPEPFTNLRLLRRQAPGAAIIFIASPGEPLKAVNAFQAEHALLDHILSKPIDLDGLANVIAVRLGEMRKQRTLQDNHLHLLRFLPTAALRRIFRNPKPGTAELFEMTVMFTDIRDSSQMIMRETAATYFAKLNTLLADQAQQVRAFAGMVVKTTGDGLLAVFEGAARCHLALKCATAIQGSLSRSGMTIGIGISDGLVMAGILGSSEHMHFDVIGSQVHTAARLCSQALAGEILATSEVADKAHFDISPERDMETIRMRGFELPVSCVRIQPKTAERS